MFSFNAKCPNLKKNGVQKLVLRKVHLVCSRARILDKDIVPELRPLAVLKLRSSVGGEPPALVTNWFDEWRKSFQMFGCRPFLHMIVWAYSSKHLVHGCGIAGAENQLCSFPGTSSWRPRVQQQWSARLGRVLVPWMGHWSQGFLVNISKNQSSMAGMVLMEMFDLDFSPFRDVVEWTLAAQVHTLESLCRGPHTPNIWCLSWK